MSEERCLVRVAHAAVATPGMELVTVGLGSCVAILLHDPVARVAGMAHVLLPHPPGAQEVALPAKYASTAVPHLIDAMVRAGATPARLVARLVGGASMFGPLLSQGALNTGARNLAAVREGLARAGVPVVGEDVGKDFGRSVSFCPSSGRAVITSYRSPEVVL